MQLQSAFLKTRAKWRSFTGKQVLFVFYAFVTFLSQNLPLYGIFLSYFNISKLPFISSSCHCLRENCMRHQTWWYIALIFLIFSTLVSHAKLLTIYWSIAFILIIIVIIFGLSACIFSYLHNLNPQNFPMASIVWLNAMRPYKRHEEIPYEWEY